MANKKIKKPYFVPVEARPDFPAMEKKTLKYWNEEGVVDKYLKKNTTSKKYFSFLDGPITANNPMGIHHAWGRTYKDLWQRYKNMQGYKQRFQNGFDCQGLWVEVEVEKELGLKSKKDIENLVSGDKKASIAKFVKLCKKRVDKYAAVQTEQSKRLGYFMDWDNSYYTLSDGNNYMIWHFLKVCNENGWLYKGKDSVPWCPRCATAISQHEILAEDYKEVVHDSIYFELPIIGKKNEYLLVWTTTPWTLPGNVAVAVDTNLDYSLVKGNSGDNFWIAKDLVDKVFGKDHKQTIKSVKGKELVGLKYKWAFDDLDKVKKAQKDKPSKFHSVVATKERILPISIEEGTGMVHIATGAGTEDFALGKEIGLPVLEVIDDGANYLRGYGQFGARNAKDDPETILGFLREEEKKSKVNWIFNIEKYRHRYPACWRCKEELVWKVTDEWYIAMDKPSNLKLKTKNEKQKTLRQRMVGVAKKMDWIPEFGLKRELDWLGNMHDWLISKKNRYWGLALPIWECTKCEQYVVIGSRRELEEKAVEGWKEFDGKTPHKPYIDEVKIKCPKCEEVISRIEPVGSPWLDAGIVAYSTVSNDNKDNPLYMANKNEWKKWIPADFITESFPGQFKNWFYSLIAMSTVLENISPARTVMGFATLIAEDGTPMHKSAGNMIEFNEGADKIGVDVMRWMYLKQSYDQNLLFGYKAADQTRRQFHLMLWNVYRFFITYANLDGYEVKPVTKLAVKNILDIWILLRLAEVIEKTTKYLDEYNAKDATWLLEDFISDLSTWYIRRSRSRVGFSAGDRGDKYHFYISCDFVLANLSKLLAPFLPFLSDEMFRNLTRGGHVHLIDWPKPNLLQKNLSEYKDLVPWMELARRIVEIGHSQRKEAKLPVRQPLSRIDITYYKERPDAELLQLIKDELNIKRVEWIVDKKVKEPQVKLDVKLSDSLKEEGKARELVRKIQVERRNMGMKLTQKVYVENNWLPRNKELIQYIKNKTLISEIRKGSFKVRKV